MCQFCVEHGEGRRWYLNSANYAFDLASDLRRRDYIVGFIANFPAMRSDAVRWMDRLEMLPTPVARMGRTLVSRMMRPHHFGQPLPLEDCAAVFELATSITVIPCICRMHTPGKRADEVCMLVTTQPIAAVLADGFKDFAHGPDLDDFHVLSRTEALRLVSECEDQGLMHSIWTFETPFTAAICNCNLESGCLAMRMTVGYELKTMWRGENVVRLDPEACVSCKACVKRCPFGALDVENGTVIAHADRCWGCGICRASCPRQALSLVDRRAVPAVAALW